MKNKLVYIILFLLLLTVGVYIRTYHVSDVMTMNTVTFFYARAKDLQTNNQYPLEDRLNYAPEVLKEDYPPFPAYFSVGIYKAVNLFFDIPFYDFIMLFPVIMYVLMCIVGFFIVANLYNKTAGFFFAALFTVMPSVNFLTQKGYYTEEAIGVFLIFLFFFFFIKSEKDSKYMYLAIVALTLLNLTWQIFIWIWVGILIRMLIFRKKIVNHLLILILPLLIGHIISVNLIGVDYSPIYMFKETYIGYKYESTEDFQIALHRGKLKPMDFQRYIKEYSYFGLIFSALGVFLCLKRLKKPEYSTLFIYTILSFVAISKYVKFRFLSLVFILILSSIGLEYAYNLDIITKLKLNKFLRKKYLKKYWKFPAILLLIILSIITIQYIRDPQCKTSLIIPKEKLEIGETYEIMLQLENIGKSALCREGVFSGVHIEVENANITEKIAYSSTTSAETVEKDYTSNGIEWFEAKFDCLKHNEKGRVTFSIKPYATPVKINYRCWMPQFCLRGPPEGILPDYRMLWRNEKCLHREPSEDELCSVPVYAGYAEKQDYYCTSIEIY